MFYSGCKNDGCWWKFKSNTYDFCLTAVTEQVSGLWMLLEKESLLIVKKKHILCVFGLYSLFFHASLSKCLTKQSVVALSCSQHLTLEQPALGVVCLPSVMLGGLIILPFSVSLVHWWGEKAYHSKELSLEVLQTYCLGCKEAPVMCEGTSSCLFNVNHWNHHRRVSGGRH